MKKITLTLATLFIFIQSTLAQNLDKGKLAYQEENYHYAKSYFISQLTASSSVPEIYLANIYLKYNDEDSAKYYLDLGSKKTDAMSFINQALLARLDKKDEATISELVNSAITKSKRKDAEIYFQAGCLIFYPKDAPATNNYIEYLDEAIARANPNTYYQIIKGDAYVVQKDKGLAIEQYNKVVEANPENALAQIKIARLYNSGKGYTAAINAYNKALTLAPNTGYIYYELADVYADNNQFDKSIETYKKYFSMNPGDNRTPMIFINKLYYSKKYNEALSEIPSLLKKDTTNYFYYKMASFCYYDLKDYKNAYLQFNKYLNFAKAENITASDYLAGSKIILSGNDTAKAIQFLKQGIALEKNNAEMLSELGTILYYDRKFNEAIATYHERKMNKVPMPSLDYYYLGRSYFTLDKYAAADSAFAMFTKANPNIPDGYWWQSRCNMFMEQKVFTGLAVQHFTKYLEIVTATEENTKKYKDNIITAYNYLGLVEKDAKKDKTKASEFFNKVLSLDPTNKTALAALAEMKKLK